MAETVVIRFRGEDDVTPVANKVAESVGKVEQSARNAGSGFSTLKEIGIGALRGIGELALDVGKNALSGTFDFFKSAVQGSAEYQSALAQTKAVIASTGGAAGMTVSEMETLARNLSAVSGQSLFTDDQILSAQNVLATFTDIEGAQFGGATQAITNLSQAMGQDLKSSAVQIGKALNDPVQGITALQRVGVSFTEDQKKVVESLMETGDVAGAQQLILDELERQFGGSAAAAAQTFSGQMVVMSEKIEDAKGAIGDALLPLLTEMGGVFDTYIMPIIKDTTAAIGGFFQGISDNGGVMATLEDIRDSIMAFVDGNPIIQRLIDLWNTLSTSIQQIYADATELASDPAVQNWVKQALVVLEALALVIIDVAIVALNALTIAFGLVVDGIKWFAKTMQPIFDYVYPKMTEFLTAISQLLRGDFAGAWQTVKTVVVTAWTEVYNVVSRVITDLHRRLSNFIGDILGTAIDIGKNIVQGIATGIMQAKASVEKALKSVIDAAIQKIKDMLGISSPSKAMASMIGVPMVQGIISGSTTGIQRAVQAPPAEASQTVQNFYLTANYQTTQSQSSVRNDLRAMQLLAGGVA